MVVPGVGEERETTLERLNYLRDSALPPVKWANQRRTNGSGDRLSPVTEPNDSKSIQTRELESGKNQAANTRASRKKKKNTTIATPRTDGECGMEAVRQKLVVDVKVSMDRIKEAIVKNEKEDERRESPPATPSVENVKRWNLRTRRGESDRGKGLKIDEKKSNCSLRQRRNNSNDKTTEGVKFCLELTKKEIEEDFIAMTGHLPPRKANKRPNVVKKHLDNFFPGSRLTPEVTANLYKVTESPKPKNSKSKAKDTYL